MSNTALAQYDKLAALPTKTLGMQLPKLTSATLKLTASKGNIRAVHEAIQAFANQYRITAGWAMLSDQVMLTQTALYSDSLLQAQYTDGNNSLHIQHLGQDRYQMTWFTATSESANTHCYREQMLVLRPSLEKSHSKVRFWFELVEHGWQPVAQQFVGLQNQAKAQSEENN